MMRQITAIENTMIYVREIQSEFTDARIDVAADYLKELIVAVKEGFKEVASTLSTMDGRLKDISDKQDETIAGAGLSNSQLFAFSAKQDSIIDAIDQSRQDVVAEVEGLRSDLKDRMRP